MARFTLKALYISATGQCETSVLAQGFAFQQERYLDEMTKQVGDVLTRATSQAGSLMRGSLNLVSSAFGIRFKVWEALI